MCIGLHPVGRQEALWRFHPVHGVGQALRLPALPVRPQRQLRRLEGTGTVRCSVASHGVGNVEIFVHVPSFNITFLTTATEWLRLEFFCFI